jgi:cell division protein FtsI (penicillin-binding protein 3)
LKERSEIKKRVYLAYGLMCLFAFAIVGQVANIQFVEGEEWRGKAQTQTTRFETIEATRGNIFSEDGSLLATSKPIYEVRWDASVPTITDRMFTIAWMPWRVGFLSCSTTAHSNLGGAN